MYILRNWHSKGRVALYGKWQTHDSFSTRVSQLKIWHFCIIGIERNVCRCTFNRCSVVTQFAKLAAREQLCRRCTHGKLWHFNTFKSLSWKITHFELRHSCCRKWATCPLWYTQRLSGNVECWKWTSNETRRSQLYLNTVFMSYAFFWVITGVWILYANVSGQTQSVPKRRHIKFRCLEITQKKAYNFQNMAKVWNQEDCLYV